MLVLGLEPWSSGRAARDLLSHLSSSWLSFKIPFQTLPPTRSQAKRLLFVSAWKQVENTVQWVKKFCWLMEQTPTLIHGPVRSANPLPTCIGGMSPGREWYVLYINLDIDSHPYYLPVLCLLYRCRCALSPIHFVTNAWPKVWGWMRNGDSGLSRLLLQQFPLPAFSGSNLAHEELNIFSVERAPADWISRPATNQQKALPRQT